MVVGTGLLTGLGLGLVRPDRAQGESGWEWVLAC